MTGSSWTSDLLAAAAGRLAAAGIGAWRPDGPAYDGSDTAIVIGGLPACPDRAVALDLYPVEDHPVLNDVTVGLQVRIRGTADPRTAAGTADAVYNTLHGLRGIRLGDTDVVLVARQSGAQLGPDLSGRVERVESYYIQAARPTAGRID